MNRRQIKPGELMPTPKLDFSGIRLDVTPEEVEQMRREVAACSLKNLSYFRKHSECLMGYVCEGYVGDRFGGNELPDLFLRAKWVDSGWFS